MSADGATHASLGALAASLAAAATALVAVFACGSSAALAAAVLALVGASSQALMLYGTRTAAAATGSRHPATLAMDAYFWSYVVAIALFSMGAGVALIEGVERLKQPRPSTGADTGLIAMAVGWAVLALAAWRAAQTLAPRRAEGSLLYALRASQDPVLITEIVALAAGALAFAVAMAGIAITEMQGWREADGVSALLIGLLLAAVAALLAIEVRRLIAGAAADETREAQRIIAEAMTTTVPLPLSLETKSAEATAASPQPAQAGQKPQLHARDTGGKGTGKRRR